MASTHEARFDYAGPYRSLERAKDILDDMFASGEVCEGEHPLVEGRTLRRGGRKNSIRQWYITLPM